MDFPVGVTQALADGVFPGATALKFSARARQNANVAAAGSGQTGFIVVPFANLADFINRQYLDYIGRSATPSEISTWTTHVTSNESGGKDLIVLLLSGYSAYNDDQADVTRLYRAFKNAIPDKSGLDYWTGQVNANPARLDDLITGLYTSGGYTATYGNLADGPFVDKAYDVVLSRSTVNDPSGKAYWLNKLATGTTRKGMLKTMALGSEGIAKARPMTDMVLISNKSLLRMPTASEVQPYTSPWSTETPRRGIQAVLSSAAYASRLGLTGPGGVNQSYDQLFTRFDRPYGMTTGDGGYSTALPAADGRIVWAYGDGAIGRISGNYDGPTPNTRPLTLLNVNGAPQAGLDYVNTILVTTKPGTNQFDTPDARKLGDEGRKGYFPRVGLTDGAYFQTRDMTLEQTAQGQKLQVFLFEWGASVPHTVIATLHPTTLAIEGRVDAPSTTYPGPDGTLKGVEWGSTLLEDPDGNTYIYGVWQWGFTQKTFLAKVPTGSLANPALWSFWTTSGWSASATNLQSVADQGTNSVVRTGASSYAMFVMSGGSSDPVWRRLIRMYTATSPTGPWSTQVQPNKSCSVPDDADLGLVGSDLVPPAPNYYSKQAIAHPEVSVGANKLLVSVVNVKTGSTDLGYGYRPRFFAFDLAQSQPGLTCTRA